ncbi:choice-of-anchor Q domain-containing protein [Lysobacter arvi]|uniref:Choice-of-anchor Q domain-containing protein n=1 Tax=Lysobacter arvi TaxID=3038776 RepID=A0ABU1CA26_9GAMM|nr:choice-of-anchor Q domain-containing protein [Lysobacter arvi]MDR0182044.1 choice-of-anchor Q domain-containing protein [Lysobacter arvi]
MSLLTSASTLVFAAAVFAGALLPASDANAATRVVTNCNDSGAGSLRNAISIAQSGDNIDLIGLDCDRILLTSGELVVPQGSLTLLGLSRDALTLDANANGRAIRHIGTGTLRVYRLSVVNGRVTTTFADGGCIKSAGTVEVINSSIHHCQAIPGDGMEPWSVGGAVAAQNVLLAHSLAYANLADGGWGGSLHAWGRATLHYSQVAGSAATQGGGGVVGSSVAVTYSLIRNNVAASGGGIALSGNALPGSLSLLVNKSTLVGNRATGGGGGVAFGGTTNGAQIIDSTFSGNIASYNSAASLPPNTRIYNSTITLNDERGSCFGAIDGVRDLHIESTVVSGNRCSTGQGADIASLVDGEAVTGSHSLVGRSLAPLPADTIITESPGLLPLGNRGGPTPTHAPEHNSPLLQRGNNALNLQYDQRGPGFPRTHGAFTDIGAVDAPSPSP